MELFVNANTLTEEVLGSIGRMVFYTIPIFKQLCPNLKLILISDDIIPDSILEKIKFDDVIYRKIKNKNFYFFLISYLPWVYEIVEKYKPNFYWEPQNYLLRKFEKTKSVVTIHDVFPLEDIARRSFFRKFLFKKFIQITLENAAYIQVPSNFTKRRILYFFGEKYSGKIKVIYHGVSTDIIPSQEGNKCICEYLKNKKPFIFFVGRLSYWKGTDILLDVAERIKKEFGLNILLAGKIIDNQITRKIDKLLKDNIIDYLGYVSDEEKDCLMQNCEIFLYPSRYDGFGQPALEAILYNKKVLMSNIDVLKEVTNGLANYFDINNPYSSILDKLKELLQSDQANSPELISFVKSMTWQNYVIRLCNVLGLL
jgi:glycosyltransferase involved in cell wall biosynthesis